MTTIAMIGIGNDHLLETLEARHSGLKALVLEPDPERARALLARRMGTKFAGTGLLAVLGGPEYSGAAKIAQVFRELHTAPILVSPDLEREQPGAVAHAREMLRRLMFQSSANDEARRVSERRYLLQTLANAPRIARESHVGCLDGLLTGVPAIIAAAGPSLDRNIHEIGQVRDRAFVIACDTAARPLLNLLLDVDVIVATDSSRANAAHLSSLPPTPAWIAAEAALHPSALVHADGRTFFFRVANHQPWPWLRAIGLDVPVLETWGSVVTSAFSLALAMGCDPILFAGADLAFTGGRPYCRGTSFEPLWGLWQGGGTPTDAIWQMLVDAWPEEYQPDLHGHRARTARHLVAFRDWVVERAGQCRDRRIVNATGAGLLAGPGIVQASLMGTLAGAPPINRADLHRRIQTARQCDAARLGRWLEAASGAIDGEDEKADVHGVWSATKVAPRDIRAALRSPEYAGWALGRAGLKTGASISPMRQHEALWS